MSTTITDDDDLTAFISPHAYTRLTPTYWDDWTNWHTEAWTDILRHLANRPDPIEEDDLSDSSEFVPAAVQHVLAQAYAYSGDFQKADYYRREYLRLLGLIKPTLVSGSDVASVGWGVGCEMERG